MAVILQSLPQEAALTKIEYEGPKIALYSKNPSYLMQNSQLVSNMVNTIKKRIVVRTDESIRKPQDESADIIAKSIPAEAGAAGTFFDPVLGEAVVFAKRPWLLAQTGEEFDNIDLAEKTGWRVKVRRAPRSMEFVQHAYRVLGETVAERTRFYREVGDKIFRDRLGESAEASLMTLGGFAEVGRSCMLLSTPESEVLLDCGINETAKDSLLAYPRFDVAGVGMDEVDAVVVTHAHMDHAGFLPTLFKYGYAGPVYCTEPTMMLMSILLRDYVKRSAGAVYSERDVEQALVHTIPLTHGIVTDISPDVKLVLSNSGHILGSASAHLHIGNGGHNLVYTGDLKFGRTLSVDNASWNFPRVETMIIESTYGGKEDISCPREEAEANLARAITSAVHTGGRVLLPVPAAGISQELLLVLDMMTRSGRIPQARIMVEKIVAEATAVYETFVEFLSKELRPRMGESEESPFGKFETVEFAHIKQGKPAIVLAPSSMLAGGASALYFKQIAGDPASKVILTSYQALETPGRLLQDGARQVTVDYESIGVRCHVERIDGFSSHSDYNQLMAYVSRLRPKLRRVLVNHGERPKAQSLASSINKIFKIQTQHPLVQEAIKLL